MSVRTLADMVLMDAMLGIILLLENAWELSTGRIHCMKLLDSLFSCICQEKLPVVLWIDTGSVDASLKLYFLVMEQSAKTWEMRCDVFSWHIECVCPFLPVCRHFLCIDKLSLLVMNFILWRITWYIHTPMSGALVMSTRTQ